MKKLLVVLVFLGLSGCFDQSFNLTVEQKAERAEEKQAAEELAAEEAQEAVERKQRGKIFGRKTREIVNAVEADKDASLVQVKMTIEGNDPLTVYSSAYGKAMADVSTIPLKQWIQIEKVVNERTPTYEDLQAWMKKNSGVNFPALPNQAQYGYDERTGEIVFYEKRKR